MPRAFALMALLALAACDRAEPETKGPSVARVLPGSVSDAMLQTDQLRVQAPYAEPLPTGAPDEEVDDDGTDSQAGNPPRTPRPRGRSQDERPGAEPSPARSIEPPATATAEPKAAPSPRPSPTP